MSTDSLVKDEKKMSDGWLRCRIFKGMFSDELAIAYTSKRDGKEASFFVPKSQVVGDIDAPGKVKVRYFRQGNTAWAVLPTDYQTAIPVDDADLLAA